MDHRVLTQGKTVFFVSDGPPTALNETGDKERPSRVTPFKHAAAHKYQSAALPQFRRRFWDLDEIRHTTQRTSFVHV